MVITIIIVLLSLIALMALHELGHFIMAKKFGVEVEEFGIGYPPRLIGKKIGETIYSLNLLPFGAFVRIKGQEGRMEMESKRAFFNKPIWQRFLILFGGAVSFWIVAIVVLSLMAGVWGLPIAISDDVEEPLARVQILGVAADSPAEAAGLEIGDRIMDFNKVKEVQDFVQENKGKEVVLNIERAGESFEALLVPRVEPPEGEGAMGVALVRVMEKKYTWYQAPVQGVRITARQTIAIPTVLGRALKKAIQGEKVEGVRFMGPIGIGHVMTQALQAGVANFLMIFVMISVWLALFNLLPIPALDGGKILFLLIEKVRGKPVNPKIEQKITAVFFGILILLMVFVTVKDIIGLF